MLCKPSPPPLQTPKPRTLPRFYPDAGPWDRASYHVLWQKTLKVVLREYPELANLVVRDFRATARTAMTDAGVPEVAIRAILGHTSRDASEGYYRGTHPTMRAAVLTLDGKKPYTSPYIAYQVTPCSESVRRQLTG